MMLLQACPCLLVAAVVSLTTAANYNDPFYTVEKISNNDLTTTFKVTGQGIVDSFTLKPDENQNLYKTDDELVIGNKVYAQSTPGSFKRYFVTVVDGDKCSERTFAFGSYLYAYNVECAPIIAKIKNVRKILFKTHFNEDYAAGKYTVNKKQNGKGATVQVIGRGVEDQFIFHNKDDAVVYNNEKSLVVGDKVFSDTINSSIFVSNGKCTEKEYKMGSIIQIGALTQARCKKVVEDMAKAKKDNSHLSFESDGIAIDHTLDNTEEGGVQPTPTASVLPITPASVTDQADVMPDIQLGFKISDSTAEEVSKLVFSNDKVKPNSASFAVDQINDGKGTVVQVVGKGIKDRFVFAPEEDVSVRKTDKVLVVGDKLYADKENSITVVYGRMCVERIYKKAAQVLGRELSNEECDSVVYNIKMAKINIPGDNDEKDFDNPTFKFAVDVAGHGIRDKLVLPAVKETKIFNKDNVLVIGDTFYTDKYNALIEVDGDKCKERTYTHGYKTSETDLIEEKCKEVKKQIANVKSFGATLNKDKTAGKGNQDVETPFFFVKKVPFSHFYNQVEVIGNGVKDKFYIPFNQDASVYDRDNVLIIGDRLYTDKANSMTEVFNGKCKQFKYENGKRISHEMLIKHDCDEINLKMSLVNQLLIDDPNKVGEENKTDKTNKVDKKDEARIIANYVESLPEWIQDMIVNVPTNKKKSFFSEFSF